MLSKCIHSNHLLRWFLKLSRVPMHPLQWCNRKSCHQRSAWCLHLWWCINVGKNEEDQKEICMSVVSWAPWRPFIHTGINGDMSCMSAHSRRILKPCVHKAWEVRGDWRSAETQVITLYTDGEQKSISKCTTWQTIRLYQQKATLGSPFCAIWGYIGHQNWTFPVARKYSIYTILTIPKILFSLSIFFLLQLSQHCFLSSFDLSLVTYAQPHSLELQGLCHLNSGYCPTAWQSQNNSLSCLSNTPTPPTRFLASFQQISELSFKNSLFTLSAGNTHCL